MWIGSRKSGISRFNTIDESFERYAVENSRLSRNKVFFPSECRKALHGKAILLISQDRNDDLGYLLGVEVSIWSCHLIQETCHR